MMKKLIENGKELRQYFFNIRLHERALRRGVMVTSIVRREILTGMEQGKITLEGTVMRIHFDSIGGGVYVASVKKLTHGPFLPGTKYIG